MMPHAKFEPKLDLRELWKSPPGFEYTISQKEISFKFEDAYLAGHEKELLFRFVVREGRLVQHVFVQLLAEEGHYLLKLKRNSPVLRTEGVKLLLAILCHYLEGKGAAMIFSSLAPYLDEGRFYGRLLLPGR